MYNDDDDDDISSLVRTLGVGLMIYSPFVLFPLLNWRQTYIHQIHFLGQDQSCGSASCDDCGQSVPWWVACELVSLIGSNTMPGQQSHYNFIGSRVYACSGVNCHLHFWQNIWGLLHATAVHRVEQTLTKSQHKQFTLEKSILLLLLPWLELTTFTSRVQQSTNKLSQLPQYNETP